MKIGCDSLTPYVSAFVNDSFIISVFLKQSDPRDRASDDEYQSGLVSAEPARRF